MWTPDASDISGGGFTVVVKNNRELTGLREINGRPFGCPGVLLRCSFLM
jgi:hypothetical protein